jgi:uncharacterized damage-inducible protein DinB
MFAQEITLNQFLLDYFEALIKDLPASGLEQQAAGKGHSALWLLGHLAISADFGRMMLGMEIKSPKRWMITFGPGSSDEINRPEKFDPRELIAAIRTGYPEVAQAAAQAEPSVMREPHGVEILNGSKIVTKGDCLAHILTAHMAMHLGQLSFWRRLQGKQPLF